jgi:hypothetical protein
VSFAATVLPPRIRRPDVRRGTQVGRVDSETGRQVICQSRSLWVSADGGTGSFRAACPPVEIDAGESLRDHLRSARFISHLPLVHFLAN